MKSGTTTLYKYMIQHPQIAKSRRKEPNFFGLNSKWKKGRSSYLKLWPDFDPAVHRYALEASTHYTKSKTARVARRMRRFGGEFRCIYILRNPVDRIESQLAHNIAKGRTPFDVAEPPQHTVEVSRYVRQLDAFRKGFRHPKILILDFEELKRAPMAVLARCVEFLEIDPDFTFQTIAPANTRKNENRANEFRLTSEQRDRLSETLRPDILDLRDRYGFDVSSWGLV
jgi:hypothetical protein